jgi:hypothetical protein
MNRRAPIERFGDFRFSPYPALSRCPLWRRYRGHNGHRTHLIDPSAPIYELRPGLVAFRTGAMLPLSLLPVFRVFTGELTSFSGIGMPP